MCAAGAAIFLSAVIISGSTIPSLAANSGTTYEEYKSGSEYTAPEDEDAYTVIEISNEDELAELAANCIYDLWSRDKYVKLTADIALTDHQNIMIPSFGGIFDGDGHRITNLCIEDSGSAVGIFRYIQESGIVRNLTVEGKVTPAGSQDKVGGIAGVNYGQIINVNFSGQVSGDTDVGGIVGSNEKSGQIRRCTSGADVVGNHSTGGIAGNNHGVLNNCSNTGDININSTEVSYDLDDITVENLEKINSTSNVSAHTDTGGVAGLSDGKLYYCTNEGTVGYNHVGYNVGGIVGRLHQGYIQNCTNKGAVYGRKDVAGIAGQMEPFLQVEYLNDTIGEISTQTDVFLNMLEKSQKDLSSYIDNAADLSRNLKDSLGDASDAGNSALNSTNDALYIYNQEIGNIASSGKEMTDAIASVEHTTENVEAGDNNIEMPDDTEAYKDALDKISSDVSESVSNIASAERTIENVEVGDYNIEVPTDTEAYKAALSKFGSDVSGSVSNASGQVSDISGDVRDSLGDMNSSMSSAENYLDELINTLDNGNNTVNSDVTALINQAKYLKNLMGNLRSDLFEYEGFSTADVSDEEASDGEVEVGYEPGLSDALYDTSSFQQGKITLCENRGSVEADTNVGGIVGQIATEYDFDPEDDVTLTGEESFNIEQTSKAVVRDSRNYADIKAKKDYVGGIVGKADFGAVISCEAYGDVESTGGNYVGGIAGSAGYSIRSCYSMGKLSGKSYVGGIVGKGCDIFYSYSYNDFDTTGERVGSIAGQVSDDGTLYGNYYVEGKPGGVDGIGYEGGATPVSYDELSNWENIPENFRVFTVVFKADDKVLDTVEVAYGGSIDENQMPEIPEKEGYYSMWSKEGLDYITGNMVLEAEYDRWISSLKSDDTDADGRSLLLVSGNFLPEYGLVAEIGDMSDDISFDIVYTDTGESVYGSLDASVGSNTQDSADIADSAIEVRVLCDEPDNMECMVQDADGKYTKVETSVMGSYLSFNMESPGTFKLVKTVDNSIYIKIAIIAAGIVIIALIIIVSKGIKKRRLKREEQKAVKNAEVVSENDAEFVG
jgi:hypothetical protein